LGLPTFAWVNMKDDRSRVPSSVRRGKEEVTSAEPSMVDPVTATPRALPHLPSPYKGEEFEAILCRKRNTRMGVIHGKA
jgi:hypothetical protein